MGFFPPTETFGNLLDKEIISWMLLPWRLFFDKTTKTSNVELIMCQKQFDETDSWGGQWTYSFKQRYGFAVTILGKCWCYIFHCEAFSHFCCLLFFFLQIWSMKQDKCVYDFKEHTKVWEIYPHFLWSLEPVLLSIICLIIFFRKYTLLDGAQQDQEQIIPINSCFWQGK